METLSKVKVEVRNVSLAYGATRVLHDVSVTVEPGEFFALLGPSGSGKSTLLRLIAGFNQAQSGQVMIGGEELSRVPPWKRDIGMVFQNYALWPHMTVAQNVAFGLEERRLARDAVRARVSAALDLVGLREFAERRPGQLSGGQQQRVALARTIAIEPKVLLLDEPLSNLDAKLRVYMRAELLALQRKLGITTIFVTHDQEEALSISDRVAVLDRGVIQQIGTPMELYDHPTNRFIADFVGTINLLTGCVVGSPDGMRFESGTLGALGLRSSAIEGDAMVAIRPHTLRLAPPDSPVDGARVWLDGIVIEREFLGEFLRYTVKVGDRRLIADEPHYIGAATYAVGNPVRLGIDLEQLRVLRP
ncbi:MAG TPA: ABC transporter ATP-binding protein [Burkholderiales bacterium]|nr:ABC transporter ATP-binding protein [Burkholderiales bacterium]